MPIIQEGELVKEVWDIKRIVIAVVSIATVVGGGYIAKENFLKTSSPVESQKSQVEGAKTQDNPYSSLSSPSEIKNIVEERIQEIRQEVIKLNVAEVASSSPQVQKVIQDIKNLEQYPQNKAKDACVQICNNL